MFKSLLVMRETKGFSLWPFLLLTLTALLAIFVCFHGSEKGGLSGSDKNHFNTTAHYIMFSFAKQYHKIYTPLTEGIEISWGWGVFKTQKFKKLCEFYWNFQRGVGRSWKNSFCGGGMDIFWSYTLSPHMAH